VDQKEEKGWIATPRDSNFYRKRIKMSSGGGKKSSQPLVEKPSSSNRFPLI
jgi:hypothetical protein